MTKGPEPPLHTRPWKPYPSQLAALVAVSDGSSLTEAGLKIGKPNHSVGALLSGCYHRLGIKDPQTYAEASEHHLSRYRRDKAIEICKARGWWPDDDAS